MENNDSTVLIDAVYAAIYAHSGRQANRFRMMFTQQCQHIVIANGEMVALNHFWRLELGGLKRNTISARECLNTEATTQSWLSNYIEYILPIVIAEGLPVRGD